MKTWSKIAIAAGTAALAGAVLWVAIAVPTLVRMPNSVNRTTTYTGTLTSTADPATGRLLPVAAEVPLRVTRTVRTVAGATTRSTAVLNETITVQAGAQTTVETNRYVVDRKTMRMRGGSNSWAFDPANVVDRTGTYRLTLPIGTRAGRTYNVWSNELDRAIGVTTSKTTTKVRGLEVLTLQANVSAPVSNAYAQALAARGIPTTISLSAIKSQLAILGFNPDQLVADVTAAAGPAAAAQVQAGLERPLPVQFSLQLTKSSSAVYPTTGEIVDTHVNQAIAAGIDPQALAALKQSLAPLAAVTSVQRTIGIIDVVASAAPNPVITTRYASTPASVASAVKSAREHARQLRIVRTGVPAGLAGLAVALFLIGLVGLRRSRTEPQPASMEGMTIDARGTEPVDLTETPQTVETERGARAPTG